MREPMNPRLAAVTCAVFAFASACSDKNANAPIRTAPMPASPRPDDGADLVRSPLVARLDEGQAGRLLLEKMLRGGQLGSRSFSALFQVASPSVVNIFTTRVVKRTQEDDSGDDSLSRYEQFFGYQARERLARSLGSGFVIDRKGFILTNHHVIENADEIKVRLHSGRELEAKVVGRDVRTDLAVIRVKPVPECRPVVFGDSSKVEIGDFVSAIGNPFGLSHTMTVGVVSAKGRRSTSGEALYDLIQTDATINPGNSGGPLFNLSGEVIGVNTSISALGKGIGFAIPINIVREIVPQLMLRGRVTRPWLGIYSQGVTAALARSFGLKRPRGALVSGVLDGSPSDRAGLKQGDILVRWSGKAVRDHDALRFIVHRAGVGRTVKIVVIRDMRRVELRLPLEAEPDDTATQEGTDTPKPTPTLGLRVMEVVLEGASAPAVVIQSVIKGKVAHDAGLRADDQILNINGVTITTAEAFTREYDKLAAGEICRLRIRRRGIEQFVAFVAAPP